MERGTRRIMRTRLNIPATAALLFAFAAPAWADEAPESTAATPFSLEATALEGDPMALFVAGRRYLIQAANTGDAAFKGKGLAYLEASAGQGFAPAARFAGALFLTGDVVPADTAEAVRWFERGAALGDADSQRTLADLLTAGEELPQDLPRAVALYEAYLANPGALEEPSEYWERTHRLAAVYADGVGVPADPARARALWAKAAGEGHYPPAQAAYARALAEGIGGPADSEAAVKAYYEAASTYLSGGLHFAIGPDTARTEARRLLAEMERIHPDARLTRLLQRQLARS